MAFLCVWVLASIPFGAHRPCLHVLLHRKLHIQTTWSALTRIHRRCRNAQIASADELKKLEKFLKVLPKYHSWDKYSVINLEFRDQVVCR